MENGEAGRATSCSLVSEGARRSICLSWVCLEDRLAPMRSLLGRLSRLPDLQKQ